MAPEPNVLYTRKWMLANHKNPAPFKQEQFDTIFSSQAIQKFVEDLKSSIDMELYVSSRLSPEDFYIEMEIFCHKTPHFPIHLSRVILPRSCHNEDSGILIFVKDVRLAGNKLAKPERTVSHYETIFRNNGIDQKNITFMPLSQLLNDYAGYEERRKLAFMYEQFIVDNDIAVKVNAFLGAKMVQDGRAAFPVDFSDPKILPDTLDETLRMVYCMYTHLTDDKESKSVFRIGRHSMSNEDIVENIIDLLYQLQDVHPGGCNNVSRLVIRASTQVGETFEIYKDESPPAYPDVDETAKDTPAEKPQEGKSFVEKVYTHISILPNDHLVPDKDDDAFNEIRRDFAQNQSPQKTPNLENQIVNALKTFMAKAKINTNTGPSGGAVTANRVIRRRRVPVTGNRNGRMF